jgi:hypothetical protein
MDILVLLVSVVALGYIVFYVSTLYKKEEGYKSCENCETVLDTTTNTQRPYVTTETSRGDFEQDFIYQNEGGRDTEREAINLAKQKFPFDWSQLPPDSSLFQAQQAMFAKNPSTKAAPFKSATYKNIESIKILPPDEESENNAEADALKQYAPKKFKSMNVSDEKDVNKLIQSIYGEKGFIAKVAKKANNVYEIYELQEKNPKIVWENEIQASIQDNELNSKVDPSEMLVIPSVVDDVQSGLVHHGSGEKTRLQKREYNDYNPNLEGIFGPKMVWQQYG